MTEPWFGRTLPYKFVRVKDSGGTLRELLEPLLRTKMRCFHVDRQGGPEMVSTPTALAFPKLWFEGLKIRIDLVDFFDGDGSRVVALIRL